MKTPEQIDAAIFALLPEKPTVILQRLCFGPFTEEEVRERFAVLLESGTVELTSARIVRRIAEDPVDEFIESAFRSDDPRISYAAPRISLVLRANQEAGCRTPGANYTTWIKPGFVQVFVSGCYLAVTEQEAKAIERQIHDAIEGILAPYWKATQ